MKTATLLDCGHDPSPHSDLTTGYGVAASGARLCYSCCADKDRADMLETGRATLYLTMRDRPEQLPGADMQCGMVRRWYVVNWPGSLSFPAHRVTHSPRGGGFGSQRTDAWFTGPDGAPWHAINRGDSQIARCRRLKAAP